MPVPPPPRAGVEGALNAEPDEAVVQRAARRSDRLALHFSFHVDHSFGRRGPAALGCSLDSLLGLLGNHLAVFRGEVWKGRAPPCGFDHVLGSSLRRAVQYRSQEHVGDAAPFSTSATDCPKKAFSAPTDAEIDTGAVVKPRPVIARIAFVGARRISRRSASWDPSSASPLTAVAAAPAARPA